MPRWWEGRLCAFDTETTGVDIEEARIVTAAVVLCGGGEPTETVQWLIDPGVEIPEGATEVHGVTTERARAEGVPAVDAIPEIIRTLGNRPDGSPVIVQNARFDLSILDREARRYGQTPLQDLGPLLVVDPLVVDKHLDRYRPGSRSLAAICLNYGAVLDAAHTADSDALAAARAAWVLGAKGRIIRRAWDEEMYKENARLTRAWEEVRHDLPRLYAAQVLWARDQALGLAEHFREKGQLEDAASVHTAWPLVPA